MRGNRLNAARLTRLLERDEQLLEIQSMDDTICAIRQKDPPLFTMPLNFDGTVNMRLVCNCASDTWRAEPSGDGFSGRFEFGPLAGTSAVRIYIRYTS